MIQSSPDMKNGKATGFHEIHPEFLPQYGQRQENDRLLFLNHLKIRKLPENFQEE